jgi:hypothetical protein
MQPLLLFCVRCRNQSPGSCCLMQIDSKSPPSFPPPQVGELSLAVLAQPKLPCGLFCHLPTQREGRGGGRSVVRVLPKAGKNSLLTTPHFYCILSVDFTLSEPFFFVLN